MQNFGDLAQVMKPSLKNALLDFFPFVAVKIDLVCQLFGMCIVYLKACLNQADLVVWHVVALSRHCQIH